LAHPRIKIFFDGGCRPNPGPIEAAVVIKGEVHWFDLGHGNNQDAEWLALIEAVKLSQTLGLEHVELIGDALEVVDHANRAMRNSAGEQGHAAIFAALVENLRPARIRWIKRQQNLAGIALASRHPR